MHKLQIWGLVKLSTQPFLLFFQTIYYSNDHISVANHDCRKMRQISVSGYKTHKIVSMRFLQHFSWTAYKQQNYKLLWPHKALTKGHISQYKYINIIMVTLSFCSNLFLNVARTHTNILVIKQLLVANALLHFLNTF